MFINIGSIVKDDKGCNYCLDEMIGQGGFGYVFRGRRKEDGNNFAIKTMLPSFSDNDSLIAFQNEMNVAREIAGDNIISYEYVHDGTVFPAYPPYIIMEYANGGTLQSLIDEGSILYSNDELIDYFLQLSNGMERINSKLVHRDIKPQNILISDNQLKISDFGLSKIAAENTRTYTFKGGGTPLYMAPEAWDYSKNTIQMDIYSMGIVFYQLATKQYPYAPLPTQNEEAKNAHLLSPVQRIELYNTNISPSLASVIYRMLEKDNRKRFAGWNKIIESLKKQNKIIIENNALEKVVASAVASKNHKDLMRQEQEVKEQKRKKEIDDFCKLVRFQFDDTIEAVINKYVEKINESYAGEGEITVKTSNNKRSKENFSLIVEESIENRVTIDFEIILKENHYRKKPQYDVFDERPSFISESYIPQYDGRDILGWAEIHSSHGLGFNLLLADSGETYGDWIIMNNKNNMSLLSGQERKEPFSFKLHELPDEIAKIGVMHSYRSVFEDYSNDAFIQMINSLLF